MISSSAVGGIAAVALALVLTPGPNMAYLVSRSVAQGRRAGFVSLVGVAVGFLVYLLLVVSGLAVVFTAVPPLYLALKLAGAVYLLWLAWHAFRPGPDQHPGAQPQAPASAPRLFAMGLVTNLLNPKIAVLYLSVLPQFIDPARGRVAAQSLVLGLVQIGVAVTVNALIVLTAGATAAVVAARPAWRRVHRYLSGTVLAGLAVKIAADRSRAAVTP